MRVRRLVGAVLTGVVAAIACAAAAPAGGWEVEIGYEGGARLLAGGGPYAGVLVHLCPWPFARAGVGFGYFELAYTARDYSAGTYGDVSGKPFFVSAEAVWPGLAVAPKFHVEVGAVPFSYSEYYKMKKYSHSQTELFLSAAPGVEFALHPRVRMTCEVGYGYQFDDFSEDTADTPFGYGLFQLGVRLVL
jgi:hypothetical protein